MQVNKVKLNECDMTATHLGQDRAKRTYWVIGKDFSRLYVEETVRTLPLQTFSPAHSHRTTLF